MKVLLRSALVLAFPCMAMAQIASLQIRVLEGEGAAHPAGAHISRPLTVEVSDELGQPVAGAEVSFQLPPEGPGGLFSNGLRTDFTITDASGRATIQSIQLNRIGGQFRILITAVKQLTRDLGNGLRAVQQARAMVISLQSINEITSTPAAPAEAAAMATSEGIGARTGPPKSSPPRPGQRRERARNGLYWQPSSPPEPEPRPVGRRVAPPPRGRPPHLFLQSPSARPRSP